VFYAQGCRCSRPLMFSDDPEHCIRCGRGPCVVLFPARAARRRRLPMDLGTLQREGRRPDPHLENVVRLDRLRPRRPTLTLVERVEPDVSVEYLTRIQAEVLSLKAAGLAVDEIADRLGISEVAVRGRLNYVSGRKLGLSVPDAVKWWGDQSRGVAA
jgi:hypothetical protein